MIEDLEWTYRLVVLPQALNHTATVVTRTGEYKNDTMAAFRVSYLPCNWEVTI